MAELCGAKTRGGGACKKPPLNGKNRCKLHGGLSTGSPKGATNAKTHGIYTKHLTESEQADFHALELGSIDDELRLTRIRLSRALAAENTANGQPEIDEITENEGGGEYVARESRKSKVRDYTAIIDKLTARIESLEKTRATLNEGEGGEGQDIDGFEVQEYDD